MSAATKANQRIEDAQHDQREEQRASQAKQPLETGNKAVHAVVPRLAESRPRAGSSVVRP